MTFSVQRLYLVMCRDMWQNRHLYLSLLALMFFFWFGLECYLLNDSDVRYIEGVSNVDAVEVSMNFYGSVFFAFMLSLWVCQVLSVSAFTFNCRKKVQVIDFLMLPATMTEKFVYRFLLCSVITFVACIIAFAAADFCRAGIQALLGWLPWINEPVLLAFPGDISDYVPSMGFGGWNLIENSFMIFIHALFFVVGCSRKKLLFWTYLLLTFLMYTASVYYDVVLYSRDLISTVFLLLSPIMYVIGYKLFIKMTL